MRHGAVAIALALAMGVVTSASAATATAIHAEHALPITALKLNVGKKWATEAGVDGGIGGAKDSPVAGDVPMTLITVPVASIDESIAKVVASGGRVVEPRIEIPGVGWYATCAEPGGLLFGMLQPDAGVT